MKARAALAALAALCLLASPARATLDLELPTLDGRSLQRLNAQTGPVLLNVWSADCPPCVAELPLLQAFARQHPEWQVWLLSVDPPEPARAAARRHGLVAPLHLLRADRSGAGLLRSLQGRGLPHSAGWRGGQLCARHTGMLQPVSLGHLKAACDGG